MIEQPVVFDDVLPGWITRECEVIIPAWHACEPDALVGHRPRDVDRQAAAGVLRIHDRRDDQIRIRDWHHVEVIRHFTDVVCLRAVLEDGITSVGLDEEMVAPVKPGGICTVCVWV